MKNLDLRKSLKDYLIITLGSLITSFSFVLFLVPYNIVAGGVNGLSLVLNYTFHWWIGAQMFAYNMILFALGFKLLGIGFGLKSIYSSVAMAFFTDFFQQGLRIHEIMPRISSGSPIDMSLMCAIYAGIMSGFGIGLVISRGATTGGTDIVSMILNKYFNTSVGTGLIMSDSLITASSMIINPLIPMYGVITIFITSKTIDAVINGLEATRSFIIISDKFEVIKEKIFDKLNRGITFLDGHGAYTGDRRNVMLVTVSRNETGTLKTIVREEDPRAFTIIFQNSEVIGHRFKKILKG